MSQRNYRLTIIGPGAMGCLLGVYLWKAGNEVSIIDHRADRAKMLSSTGIQVEKAGATIEAFPRILVDPSGMKVQDFVIVLVKSYQNEQILPYLGQIMGRDTMIVSLQNGIGHEKILKRIVPEENIILGVTSQGATLISPGTVRHAGQGKTVLGTIKKDAAGTGRVHELIEIFNNAEWDCEYAKDIHVAIWKKLIVNVGINAITALCRIKNGQIIEHPEGLKLQRAAVKEALEVARHLGVPLEMDDREVLDMVKMVCTRTADNFSSMLQDVLKGRQTEIDFINGAITSLGKRLDVATPVNECLTRLIRLNTIKK